MAKLIFNLPQGNLISNSLGQPFNHWLKNINVHCGALLYDVKR